MLHPDEVLSMTGHPVGGVCPFANPEGVRVVCDESLRRFRCDISSGRDGEFGGSFNL